MAADWENMYNSYSENRSIRRTTLKRSTTLPRSQSADEGTGSSPSNLSTRPSSSDRNLGVSPSMRRPYVNLTGIVPVNNNKKKDDEAEHIYENVSSQQKTEISSTSPTYENWTPKMMSPKTTPTHTVLNVSPSLPLFKKPIPPPLIIKRHELMSDQNEAKKIGSATDSFIVPNLTHYSQVSVGGSLELSGEHEKPPVWEKEEEQDEEEQHEEEWIKQKAKFEEIGQTLYNEVQAKLSRASDAVISTKEGDSELSVTASDSFEKEQRDTLTNGSDSKHSADKTERRNTLTPDNVDSEEIVDEKPMPKIKKGEDLIAKVESTKKDERLVNSSSPQMMTKLAQLTQLPQRTNSPVDSIPPTSSKSFSVHQTTVGHVFKPSKSLPKGYRKPHFSRSAEQGETELNKKLERQRKRLDKQLSFEQSTKPKNDSGLNTTLSVDLSLLKEGTDLSKFGIIEDESGGSFIV